MLDLSQFDTEEVVPGLESYVEEFFLKRSEEFKTLRSQWEIGAFKDAMEITHKWKGFCAPYGFGYLGQLSAELDLALKNEDVRKSKELLEDVRNYFGVKSQRMEQIGGRSAPFNLHAD